jgi:HK97 family phage prohead protease
MTKSYPIEEFPEVLAREGDAAAAESIIRMQTLDAIEAKADAEETRMLSFTISTASMDRDRDVISLDGWDFSNFAKNPVVLWAHNYRQLPVGRSSVPYRSGNKLKADVIFTPKGLDAFNDTVFSMYRLGFMRAVSVGFRPRKWNINEERRGYDFIEQELLEFSAVPVPANPEALMDAKGAGIDIEPLRKWARMLLDEPEVEIPAVAVAEASPVTVRESVIIPEPWKLSLRLRQIEIESLR